MRRLDKIQSTRLLCYVPCRKSQNSHLDSECLLSSVGSALQDAKLQINSARWDRVLWDNENERW